LLSRLVYSLYTRILLSKVQAGDVPQHVAVILDGNRRFAESMGTSSVTSAYQQGAWKVRQFLEWCQSLRIPQVTLWVLSLDNLRRSRPELREVLQVIEQEVVGIAESQRISQTPRRIRFLGQLNRLPAFLQNALGKAENMTARYNDFYLNVAVAYGGREEIVDAVRKLLVSYGNEGLSLEDAVRRVTVKELGDHLYLEGVPDPDLIIRTSGEIRLSGFMLWQSVYSEYYFCDAYWPTFRQLDLLRAVRSFQQRKRRFGQ